MSYNFIAEYAQRNDDELLHLASQRHSLTTEAADALEAELGRRNLTESDRLEHKRFVKRQEQLESRKHRKKALDPFKYQMSWRDILEALAAIAMVSFIYIELPSRYHLKSDWQDPAFIALMTLILITLACRRIFWRKFSFWISLLISSPIHLIAVHAWTQRVPNLSRGGAKLAGLLGMGLFLSIYWFIRLLRRMLYGNESNDAERQLSPS